MRETRSGTGKRYLLALALAPALAAAAPTPPPPAPDQKLGQVTVVDESRGTRTVIDSAGRTHTLMRRVTPADRQAAAARAKATRETAQRLREGNDPQPPASKNTHPKDPTKASKS
jgi:hypothetical protein